MTNVYKNVMIHFWKWLVSIWHWIRPYGLSPKPAPIVKYRGSIKIIESHPARVMNGRTIPGGETGRQILQNEAEKIMAQKDKRIATKPKVDAEDQSNAV